MSRVRPSTCNRYQCLFSRLRLLQVCLLSHCNIAGFPADGDEFADGLLFKFLEIPVEG